MMHQKFLDLLNQEKIEYDNIASLIKDLYKSEGNWDTLRQVASERSRDRLYVFFWLIENFIIHDELVEAATPILHGLIPNYTICSHCEFDVAIPLMLKLAHIYHLLGDFDNATKSYQQTIAEIQSAKNLALRGGGIEYLVKIHMIKRLEGRSWMVNWQDGSGVVVSPSLGSKSLILIGDSGNGFMLAESGTLTLLDAQLSIAYAEFAKLIALSGNPKKADELFMEAQKIDENIENWINLGATYNDLGNLAKEQGFIVGSRKYYFKALDAHSRSKNKKGMANALTNIGLTFSDPNLAHAFNPSEALKYLLQSLPIQQEVGNQRSELNAIIGIYQVIAAGRGRQSVSPVSRGDNFPSLPNEAKCLIKENLDLINYALNIFRNLPTKFKTDDGYDGFKRMSWHNEASQIYFMQGNHVAVLSEVREYCAKFNKIFASVNTMPTEAIRKLLDESADIIERGIKSALELYSQQGDQQILYLLVNLIERVKSRNMIKALYTNVDIDVVNRMKAIGALEDVKVTNAKIVTNDPAALREREELIRNLASITQAIDRLQSSTYFSRSFPSLEDDLVSQFRIAVERYSQAWAIVEMFVLDQELILLIITGNNVALHRLHINLAQLKELAGTRTESNEKNLKATLNLGREILIHITDLIKSIDYIFVIPHNDLHAIPWESLFESRAVVRTYNLDMLILVLSDESCADSKIGLIACPDSAINETTQQEIDFVSNAFENLGLNPIILLGDTVTKENIICNLEKSQIAHLICHAAFDMEVPLSSYLLLSNDEKLLASEIFSLKGRPNLLFLNACEAGKTKKQSSRFHVRTDEASGTIIIDATSKGENTVYDEQLGIVSAFLASGSKSMIVPTTSITVFDAFEAALQTYSTLLSGKSIGHAIQEVSTKRLASGHPMSVHALFGNPFYKVKEII